MAYMTTTTAPLTPALEIQYNRNLLETARREQILTYFAETKSVKVRSNSTKVKQRRYFNVLPATVPLAEFDGTNYKAPNKIKYEEVEYGVNFYGDYIMTNDRLPLLDFHDVKRDYLDILGYQAAETVETIRLNELLAGTNVVFAEQKATRNEVASSGAKATKQDLRIMALKLKRQRAKKWTTITKGDTKIGTTPIGAAYPLICSTELADYFCNLPEAKTIEQYAGQTMLLPGEVCKIGEFRIIDFSLIEPVDVNGKNVHFGVALGKGSFATTKMDSKGEIETIVHDPGSAGAGDPLNLKGSIGWKAIAGAAILNQAHVCRLESTVDLEDNTPLHFYDYSK
jgi:N4-gp56 family major capsid protein